jgi:GTP cyclohydrolase FolE2
MIDTQSETMPDIGLMAGIKDLKVTLISPKWTLLLNVDVQVPIKDQRGAHMSRLVIPHKLEYLSIEDFITFQKQIIFEKTGQFPYIKINFQFPWKDQFTEVEITNYITTKNTYNFKMSGITACPCSKETCGVGHMQKCSLQVKTFSSIVPFEEIFTKMETCFSSTLTEFLKRPAEAAKIVEAQNNAKFVEDVTRDAIKKIPNIHFAEAISEESIHSHRAVCTWKQ